MLPYAAMRLKSPVVARLDADLIATSSTLPVAWALWNGADESYAHLPASRVVKPSTGTIRNFSATTSGRVLQDGTGHLAILQMSPAGSTVLPSPVSISPGGGSNKGASISRNGEYLFYSSGTTWYIARWNGTNQYVVVDTVVGAQEIPEYATNWNPSSNRVVVARALASIVVREYAAGALVKATGFNISGSALVARWLNDTTIIYYDFSNSRIGLLSYNPTSGAMANYQTAYISVGFTGVASIGVCKNGTRAYIFLNGLSTRVIDIAGPTMTLVNTLAGPSSGLGAVSESGKYLYHAQNLYSVNAAGTVNTLVPGFPARADSFGAFVPYD